MTNKLAGMARNGASSSKNLNEDYYLFSYYLFYYLSVFYEPSQKLGFFFLRNYQYSWNFRNIQELYV